MEQCQQNEELAQSLKQKRSSYNKLLITVNQDLLDRIIYDSSNIQAKFKIIDYLAEAEQVKMVQLLDENSIILNWKKQP